MSISRGEEKVVAGRKVYATKAVHTQDSVGYVIQNDELSIYHSGDTMFFMGSKEVGEQFGLDLAFLPIDRKWGNMGVPEAVVSGKLLHPRVLIPMHYGMFGENTADPSIFKDAARVAMPDQKLVPLGYKERFTYTQ